ncbi:hypothetical protein N7454_007026 [Penicillium verhagenii]|nr:hypothetical protein N7454_007026 [Penicillium verhagenii]
MADIGSEEKKGKERNMQYLQARGHQSQNIAVRCNTSNDSVEEIITLENARAIVNICYKEDLVQLILDAANEGEVVISKRINRDQNFFTSSGHRNKADEIGSLGNLTPRSKTQTRGSDCTHCIREVVEQTGGGITNDDFFGGVGCKLVSAGQAGDVRGVAHEGDEQSTVDRGVQVEGTGGVGDGHNSSAIVGTGRV